MKSHIILLPLLLLLLSLNLRSQAQGFLDNRFRFNDGIYLSAEEYFSNAPSIKFEESIMPEAKYGKFNESQFREIYYKNHQGDYVRLDLRKIWGISVKGVAYVYSGFSIVHENDISFLTNTIKKSRNLIFSEIIYVGNISMYYFKHENWMIKASTCKTEKITLKKVKENIQDDPELLSAFYADKNKRKNKHSFLVKYNQRHPVYTNHLAQN
ncbi:MAG: hypothetical protein M3512_09310 [Bacteroidota bacterium]|nr:hypothetical protein [Bacteroidota bacterium]